MNYNKQKAIELLNCMFNIPDGYRNSAIEAIVDNIITAAVTEMKKATEKPLEAEEEVQG